ncbi:MAG: hypothetical protein EOO50_12950 [Flavobacterium sp.]|uniref:tetratricopeptide repeat protein n=1 Tax=Flavobacterium sp. TaxID=239 RepID=UPI0012091AAB|nr:hypothetical protein [Flavobacterium sp.]RZJ65652.1 MAG: hypothetical protein EOO50_12950 [Flavobacterium sp.]
MSKRLILLLLIFTSLAFSQSDEKKAEQFFEQKKYSEAKAIYLEIYSRQPSNANVVEHLGDLSAIGKKWQTASHYYNKLVALNPNDPEAHYKFGGAMAMDAAQTNKLRALTMISNIEASFEKAIRLDPKHINARWALIEFYLQLPGIFGGSESKAAQYANELAKLSPVDHYLAKARIDEYFERYEKAEKNYVKAHEIGQSETTKRKLASIRIKLKNASS